MTVGVNFLFGEELIHAYKDVCVPTFKRNNKLNNKHLIKCKYYDEVHLWLHYNPVNHCSVQNLSTENQNYTCFSLSSSQMQRRVPVDVDGMWLDIKVSLQ